MEFTGRVAKVLEARSGVSQSTGNPWMSQDFVFEYFEHETDRYADRVVLTLFGEDRVRQADLHEGDTVTVGFGHSVREYQGRWFNEVRAYKVEKAGAAGVATGAQQTQQAAGVVAQPQQTGQDRAGQAAGQMVPPAGGQAAAPNDDLPF